MWSLLKSASNKMIKRQKSLKVKIKVSPNSLVKAIRQEQKNSLKSCEEKQSTLKSCSHSCHCEEKPSTSKSCDRCTTIATMDTESSQKQKNEFHSCEKKHSTHSDAVLECIPVAVVKNKCLPSQTVNMTHSTTSVHHIVRQITIKYDNKMLIYIIVLLALCTLIGALSLVIQLFK